MLNSVTRPMTLMRELLLKSRQKDSKDTIFKMATLIGLDILSVVAVCAVLLSRIHYTDL